MADLVSMHSEEEEEEENIDDEEMKIDMGLVDSERVAGMATPGMPVRVMEVEPPLLQPSTPTRG